MEQLTYLLFLKLLDDRADLNRSTEWAPTGEASWRHLRSTPKKEVVGTYARALRLLASAPGVVGIIYEDARNRVEDPTKLANLIRAIDLENWSSLDRDVKGELYEGLLQKSAEDVRSGAGQYFTPRALVEAIVACVQPRPMRTISDPACGTGGFLLAVHASLSRLPLETHEAEFLRLKTFSGTEIVPATHRLCLMNLHLHGIGRADGAPAIERRDALTASPQAVDYVFANPPFGRRSTAIDSVAGGAEALRGHHSLPTSNKQLAFLQHVMNMLKPGGSAAVVVPDNVLFERGVGDRVRQRLLTDYNLHTVLRLPTGILYAQGVKANVLFFDRPSRRRSRSNSESTWFYDLRAGTRLSLRSRPLQAVHLADFVESFRPGKMQSRVETERFRRFDCADLLARAGANLDARWSISPHPSSVSLPNLNLAELQAEIVDHLESALKLFGSRSS